MVLPISTTLPQEAKKALVQFSHKATEHFFEGVEVVGRVAAVAENLAAVTENHGVQSDIETLDGVLGTIDLVNTASFWISGKRKSWQHTASAVCSTMRQVVNTVEFMGVNLEAVAGTVGTIPVLGLIMNASKIVGYSLSIWHNVKVIKKANKDHQDAGVQKQHWEQVTQILNGSTEGLGENVRSATIFDRICNVMRTSLPEEIKRDVMEILISENRPVTEYEQPVTEQQLSQLNNKLLGRVKVLKAEQERAAIEKKKSRASIVHSVNSIALAIIIIVGMIVAPFVTGAILAAYGLYMSSYALGMYLYQRHLEHKKELALQAIGKPAAAQGIEMANLGDMNDAVEGAS